jgi:cytochrome c-type biogenesis protein CcmH
MSDPITTLRAQLQQLEARHRDGALGKKEYEQRRAALERELVDQVLKAPATAAPAVPADAAPRPSTRLLASLAAVVLAVAAGGYAWTGSPRLISGVPTAPPAAEGSPHDGGANAEQFAAAVERLAEKLKEQPDNVEGWAMLARSYLQLGRVADAVPAFAKAVALKGDDPRLLADYADALAVTNNRSIEGEPLKLIERALKLDPNNLKSLALAGTAAFNRKDYAGAVRHWEKMAQVAPPDSPFLVQLNESLAEARQLGGMPAATPKALAAAPTPPAATLAAPAAAATGALRGTVKLAPALAKQAAPTDTVFIYARPAEGSRMPLAILRKQVKDLPFEFALDDSLAMSPAATLSMHAKVIVDVRVTKTGQAQAAPGDLTGRTAPIANNATGVVIEISDVVRN